MNHWLKISKSKPHYVSNGYSTLWFLDKRLHREDGPAVEHADGSKYWYRNGKLHREDGPAMEFESTYRAWFQNGARHRLDGPAVEYEDGSKEYWVFGERLSEAVFKSGLFGEWKELWCKQL